MAVVTLLEADIQLALWNGHFFNDSRDGDVLFTTTTPAQAVRMGTVSNAASLVCITSNTVTVSGDAVFDGTVFTAAALSNAGTTSLAQGLLVSGRPLVCDCNVALGPGAAAHAPLQFGGPAAASQLRTIVLCEQANNDHEVYALGVSNAALRYQACGSNAAHSFSVAAGAGASTEVVRIQSGSNAAYSGLPPAALYCFGNLWTEGDVITRSDGRAKVDVRRIEGAVDKVAAISGYTYAFDAAPTPTSAGPGRRHMGLLAQEVHGVMPEAVHGGSDQMSVAYGNLVALLVEAVKELTGRVQGLGEEISLLKGGCDCPPSLPASAKPVRTPVRPRRGAKVAPPVVVKHDFF
jgi:hypothetical protein